MWFVAVHSGWRLQPLNDREPDLVVLTHALGCFLSDADGQAHTGLKACHMNQVLSLHRWKHARYQQQWGREQREEKEWKKTRRGKRSKICLHKVAVCGVGMCFQLMITNDISEWPPPSDSFLDVTHSELLRTWQVNNIISSCMQTAPLTTVKYQHKANTAYIYAAACGAVCHVCLHFIPKHSPIQFLFSSALDGKTKPTLTLRSQTLDRPIKQNATWHVHRESARVQPCRTNIPHSSAVTCILKIHLQFLVWDPFSHPGLHVLFM